MNDAMTSLGLSPDWREHCRQDENAPPYAQKFGSPTILVDGEDVAPAAGAGGNACRIYRDADGRMSGLPPREDLVRALKGGSGNRAIGGLSIFASLLAGIAGLLPAITCPACWPAYGAILAAMGFNFVDYTPYLLPAMLTLAGAGLFGLLYRASSRRGYGPLALGVVATAAIFAGRFYFEWDPLLYAGAALFVSAAVWNLWPRRRESSSAVSKQSNCEC
ncbi:MAG: MerC domain-containing protein [bacterium]|nr:MerC domain-containing protein [bacterium]